MRTFSIPFAIVSVLTLASACNHTPVSNLEKSFSFKVQAGTGDGNKVKIDFLWVIDNSTSMCQEQLALTDNFQAFVDSLEETFDVDARIAVTSVDAQCQNDGRDIFAARGKFNQHVNRTTGITCQRSIRYACTNDDQCSDCAVLGNCESDGDWSCNRLSGPECLVAKNGSLNTACKRDCETDAECKEAFDDDRYVCRRIGDLSGCLVPPQTTECPQDSELPPFLEKNDTVNNSNLFKCIADVGVSQASCLRFEQPLRAGYMALDPAGDNQQQAASFLRDDAYLVVIFVTDEEDCSVADGRDGEIVDTQQFRCGIFNTTDKGGPLQPPAYFVNKFRALKDDPGRVIVAAIAGDSLKTDPADIQLERDAWRASKESPKECDWQAYVCNSETGTADFGSRMLEFADAFGPNGSFQNICGEGGIQRALDNVSDTIVSVLNKLCLPKPVLSGLTVTRTRRGETTTLTEGQGPGTYTISLISEECEAEGQLMPSLIFADRPEPGDEINVVYRGDPQLP